MPEEIPGDGEELSLPPPFFPQDGPPSRGEEESNSLVEVDIEGVFAIQLPNGQINQFVLLTDGDRKMPIMIGPFEANSITQALEKLQPDRPFTHDLMKTMMDRMEVSVDRIHIDDLWNTTYYAKIVLRKGNEEIEIDSRPSDALAMAVRFDAPVWVSERILDSAEEL